MYKGTFEEGIPRDSELSSYVWADVDRADLVAQEEAEAVRQPSWQRGQARQEGAPQEGRRRSCGSIGTTREGLGSVALRTGGPRHIAAQKAELEAAKNDPKAAKSKGKDASIEPAEGEEPPPPVPPAEAPVPHELQRKFRLTVRKVAST